MDTIQMIEHLLTSDDPVAVAWRTQTDAVRQTRFLYDYRASHNGDGDTDTAAARLINAKYKRGKIS